jgi:hypothetical protein
MAVIAPTAYATVTDLAQLGVAPAALAAVTVPEPAGRGRRRERAG